MSLANTGEGPRHPNACFFLPNIRSFGQFRLYSRFIAILLLIDQIVLDNLSCGFYQGYSWTAFRAMLPLLYIQELHCPPDLQYLAISPKVM